MKEELSVSTPTKAKQGITDITKLVDDLQEAIRVWESE